MGAPSAFFFDFDGTLTEIAPRPDAVVVDPALPAALERLHALHGGAVALISGRPLAEIDHFLGADAHALPAAGVHGLQRRGAGGHVDDAQVPDLGAARDALSAWCADRPALCLEVKPGTLALHYRGADALERDCLEAMRQAHRLVPGMVLLHGKKVIELKPDGIDKGRAVRAFMAEAPFAGRRPWYFGDDVTDEDAFLAVNALGGVSVKVGPGDSHAPWQLPDPAALRAWIAAQASVPA